MTNWHSTWRHDLPKYPFPTACSWKSIWDSAKTNIDQRTWKTKHHNKDYLQIETTVWCRRCPCRGSHRCRRRRLRSATMTEGEKSRMKCAPRHNLLSVMINALREWEMSARAGIIDSQFFFMCNLKARKWREKTRNPIISRWKFARAKIKIAFGLVNVSLTSALIDPLKAHHGALMVCLMNSLVGRTASVVRRRATSRRRGAFGWGSSGVIRTWRWGTSRDAPSPRPSLWSSPAGPVDPAISRSRSSFQRRTAFRTSGVKFFMYGSVCLYESESKKKISRHEFSLFFGSFFVFYYERGAIKTAQLISARKTRRKKNEFALWIQQHVRTKSSIMPSGEMEGGDERTSSSEFMAASGFRLIWVRR